MFVGRATVPAKKGHGTFIAMTLITCQFSTSGFDAQIAAKRRMVWSIPPFLKEGWGELGMDQTETFQNTHCDF
jgi:hypothetical protein